MQNATPMRLTFYFIKCKMLHFFLIWKKFCFLSFPTKNFPCSVRGSELVLLVTPERGLTVFLDVGGTSGRFGKHALFSLQCFFPLCKINLYPVFPVLVGLIPYLLILSSFDYVCVLSVLHFACQNAVLSFLHSKKDSLFIF